MSTSRPKHIPIVIHIPISRSPSPPSSLSSESSSGSYASYNSSPPPSPTSVKDILTPSQLYSSSKSRPRRLTPPQQTLLGAIDENSGAVLPDIPVSPDNKNNPVAKLHVYSGNLGSKRNQQTIASGLRPPPNELERLMGPNGERFTDMRMNRKANFTDTKKGGFRKIMCFG